MSNSVSGLSGGHAGPSRLPRHAVMAPVVSPLWPDQRPDVDSIGSLVDFHVGAGTDGVLVVGSSGESASLAATDRLAIAGEVAACSAGRLHVMGGIYTYGTADATKEAVELAARGVDSLLLAPPAGLPLSQSELSGHYRMVAEAVDVPVMAYDVPGRVGNALTPDLVAELGADGVIAGLKDSSGDINKARIVAVRTADIPDFVRYTGSEYTIDSSVLLGYDGAIPGLANIFPQFHVELMKQAAAGQWATASRIQGLITQLLEIYELTRPLSSFSATFEAIVKEALRILGVVRHNTICSPQTPVDESVTRHVEKFLELGTTLTVDLHQLTTT